MAAHRSVLVGGGVRWAGATLLALAAALVAGCGSSNGGGDAPAPGDPQGATTGGAASLLLRGRLEPDTLVLEPVFLLSGERSGGEDGGPHRLVGFDDAGTVLFDVGVGAAALADAQPGEEHFQLLLPTTLEAAARLHRVELRAADGRTTRRTATSSEPEIRRAIANRDVVSATRTAEGRVRLSWPAARFPALMAVDPQTGQVLTFARGGEVTLRTDRDTLRVTISDGVRSASGSVAVR